MPRVTVYHLTPPAALPLIEEQGLRTRADLSDRLGEPGPFDQSTPGAFAHGRRVSGYLRLEHARSRRVEHGAGLVSFTVDPRKALAARTAEREANDPAAYWASAASLADWDDLDRAPSDLEVHVNVPVRAKHVRLHAPLFEDADLGEYAELVRAVADEDRLSAKALMHLALVRSDGELATPEFRAACALAWRDEPDDESLIDELFQIGADKVASAALAEFGSRAHDAAGRLRETLEETREWADTNGEDHARALFLRSAAILDEL